MSEIERLIAEADRWRRQYLQSGDGVMAAASLIRMKALQDAIRAIKREMKG